MAGDAFRLEKWYLDAIDASGRTFVGYASRLQWRSVRLSYQGHLLLNSAQGVERHDSFGSAALPVQRDDRLVWSAGRVTASYRSLDPPIQELLHSTPGGITRWECTQPKCQRRLKNDPVEAVES